jgi:hypothetical protein
LIRFGALNAGTESSFTIHRDIVGTQAINAGIKPLLQPLKMHYAEKKDQFSDESNPSNHCDDDEETHIQ